MSRYKIKNACIVAILILVLAVATTYMTNSTTSVIAENAPKLANDIVRLDFETADQVTGGSYIDNYALGHSASMGSDIATVIVGGEGTDGTAAAKMRNPKQYTNMALMRLYEKNKKGEMAKGFKYIIEFDYRAVTGDVNIMPMISFMNDAVDADGVYTGNAKTVNRDIPIATSSVWSHFELYFTYEQADGKPVIKDHNLHYQVGMETLILDTDLGFINLRFDTHSGDYANGVYLDNFVFRKVVDATDFTVSGQSVAQGNFKHFGLSTTPSNADTFAATWSSSDSSIASVDADGTVSGKATGSCSISATLGGITKSYSLTVVPRVAATSIEVQGIAQLKEGNEHVFTATLLPSNCNDGLIWSTSDISKAYVDKSGKVIARTAGTVSITASNGEINKIFSLTITPRIPIEAATDLVLSGRGNLKVGQVVRLYVDIVPEDTTYNIVEYVSDNTQVVTINGSGVMRAITVGSAVITVTKDTVIKTFNVTVTEIEDPIIIASASSAAGCSSSIVAPSAIIIMTALVGLSLAVKKLSS